MIIRIEDFAPFLPEAVFLIAACVTLNWIQGYLGRYHLGHLVAGLALSYGIAFSLQDGLLGPAASILAAIGFVILNGIVIGVAALVTTSEVFVLVSLAWLLVFTTLVEKGPDHLTGGDGGIRMALLPSDEQRFVALLLSVALLMGLVLCASRLEDSRLVMLLRAYRDNPELSRYLRLPRLLPLVIIFIFSSLALAPFSLLRSLNLGWVLPESFSIDNAFVPVIALAFGGSDKMHGAIIGPLIVVSLEAGLVLMNFEAAVVPVLYLAVVILLRWRPAGLIYPIARERSI